MRIPRVIPAVLFHYALAVLVVTSLLLVGLALDRVAAEKSARVAQLAHVQQIACERQNDTRRVLVTFLAEARQAREREGTLTPDRGRFFDRAIEELKSIDCAALPRGGE